MTDKPNPYVGRPIKWLIPEWLITSDQFKEICDRETELRTKSSQLYEKKTALADAIRKTAKPNQVFLLKDGRAITVNNYGVELCPTTELVATVRKDMPTGG